MQPARILWFVRHNHLNLTWLPNRLNHNNRTNGSIRGVCHDATVETRFLKGFPFSNLKGFFAASLRAGPRIINKRAIAFRLCWTFLSIKLELVSTLSLVSTQGVGHALPFQINGFNSSMLHFRMGYCRVGDRLRSKRWGWERREGKPVGRFQHARRRWNVRRECKKWKSRRIDAGFPLGWGQSIWKFRQQRPWRNALRK